MNQDMFEMLLVFGGLMALLGTIAKIALSLINRRRPELPRSSVSLDDLARRIDHLQQSVDATAVEVERLGESQRFTTRLLAERAVASGSALPLESPPNPAAR